MDLHLRLDDAFVLEMERRLGRRLRAEELGQDALTLLSWAIHESAQGRRVVSCQADGSDPRRLVMPILAEAHSGSSGMIA